MGQQQMVMDFQSSFTQAGQEVVSLLMSPNLDLRLECRHSLRKMYYDGETGYWVVMERGLSSEKYKRVEEHRTLPQALKALTLGAA